MIREHDQWSRMGEEKLGEPNIKWASMVGPMVLMKAILNDYWADTIASREGWDRDQVDEVMSKLYWCWVAEMDRQTKIQEME